MNFKTVLGPTLALTLAAGFSVQAQMSPLQERVYEIMQMDHRDEADTKRDRNRNPIRALEFIGMQTDMKVIEFAPGNGWYTKILAPLLKDDGELYLAYPEEWLKDMDPLLAQAPMSKAKKLPIELSWNYDERRYDLGNVDFAMTDADMVLNIREYHNFNPEDKAKLNEAAFAALKSGGKYVIIDHSRRHMQPETFELRRREDPVEVILEVQEAGFKLLDASDMFYRPDDELRYEVGRKTVTGNTDRFTLVFVKP